MLGKRKLGEAQKQKKKKKWIEELDDDSEEIDLDCLNNLEEQERADLEKEDEEVNQEEEKNDASSMAVGGDETITENGNNKKKKRYDWMSSDDEDISSEEDEEEEEVELVEKGKEKKEQEQGGERTNSSGGTLLEPDNAAEKGILSKNSSALKGGGENGNVGYHPNGVKYDMNNGYGKCGNIRKMNIDERSSHSDDGPVEIIENINKYSINPLDIKLEEIEHLVTCVTENLVDFLEKFTKNKIVQINSDKSTNHTIIYKYDEKNNDTVLINKFPHYGKLFVHVKNYQVIITKFL
ncbi:hypothetical protein PCYB_141620 [Plasmodium cynomolgi strain B]|uniref:Uncharacterized protein n=1 Tax=Plasmodium cynomolgi (strain B) TaxID=1120755 RepID=K6UY26_PLACD|nr:hypothetical protein PCYB_141620 [Plasmodium cynomolgi strain B]GAB68734.1 hypothetical protein PCYB_141620 [Plasmodium cynomolgi strain B]